MKKQVKKIIAALAASILIVVATVSGTLAYLTATETVTNTFTVGNVEIELEEPNWPDTIPEQILPNQVIEKDPQVTNTGNYGAVVFLKVDVPTKNYTHVADDGTVGELSYKDVVYLRNINSSEAGSLSVHETSFDENWMLLTGDGYSKINTNDNTGSSYILAYETILEPGKTTTPAFQNIQIANAIEGAFVHVTQEIGVTAYAIQASDIYEGDSDLTQNLSEDNLKKIYDTYLKQEVTSQVPYSAEDHEEGSL